MLIRSADNEPEERLSRNKEEGPLSGYYDLLFEYRKVIGYIVLVGLVLSIITRILLPREYIATSRVLPPQENEYGLASLLAGGDDPLSGIALSLIGNKTSGSLYVGIMRSRSVADALVKKFDLRNRYGHKYIEDVYLELKERSIIAISKNDQIIVISVKDHDPRIAADMANTYVEMLGQKKRELNNTQGKRKRLFLEGRLKEVRGDLETAETNLKAFQEKYHLVSIEEQAKAAIEGAAEIKSRIIAAQTELEVHKQFGTVKQIEAVMLQSQISELQEQLGALEHGDKKNSARANPSNNRKGTDFLIPFNDLPRLGMQFARLLREAKVQEKLFELLTAQYEMARIEEAKDVDPIQVLDSAVPPEDDSNTSTILIVLVFLILSLIISIVYIHLAERFRDSKFKYQALIGKLREWRRNG